MPKSRLRGPTFIKTALLNRYLFFVENIIYIYILLKRSRRTFITIVIFNKVSNYVVRRDLLYDEYPQMACKRSYITKTNENDKTSMTLDEPDFQLLYPLYNGALILFRDYIQYDPTSSSLYPLVRSFLDTVVEKRKSSRHVSNMPEPDNMAVSIY